MHARQGVRGPPAWPGRTKRQWFMASLLPLLSTTVRTHIYKHKHNTSIHHQPAAPSLFVYNKSCQLHPAARQSFTPPRATPTDHWRVSVLPHMHPPSSTSSALPETKPTLLIYNIKSQLQVSQFSQNSYLAHTTELLLVQVR
jgi:hypothetical protein